jgi:hypothetical protein
MQWSCGVAKQVSNVFGFPFGLPWNKLLPLDVLFEMKSMGREHFYGYPEK